MSNTEERDLDSELLTLLKELNKNVLWDKSVGMPGDVILNRNRSLRILTKAALGGISLSLMVGMVLTYGVVTLANRDNVELAYGIDSDNRIVELAETTVPNVTDAQVMEVTAELVRKFHLYSTKDWERHVDSFQKDFVDKKAFEDFMFVLKRSKVIERIEDGIQMAWAELDSAPVIVDKSEDGNSWELEVDFRWYVGGGSYTSAGTSLRAHITLQRVSRAKNSNRLAVAEYADEPLGVKTR
jgi:hypothetical protein